MRSVGTKNITKVRLQNSKKMKVIDVVAALRFMLWTEFIFANICILLSKFLSFEVCLYLLFGMITALNGIGALQIELKLKKEEENYVKQRANEETVD